MRRFFLSFFRLRWKLTASYVLVTVGALVVAQLVLVAAIAVLIGSGLLPQLMARALSDVATEARPYLERSPPDISGMERDMDVVLVRPNGDQSGPGIIPYPGAIFLLDSDGAVLGGMPAVSRSATGEPFDAGETGELEVLVGRALGGVSDPARLSGRSPGGDLMAVSPIEGGDGRVRGVVVGVVGLPTLAGPLFTGIVISAVVLTVAAGIVSLIFGFITAWGLSRRLRRLTEASRAWSAGEFSFEAKDRSHDELGELARDLNRMSAELETLLETRQELATLEARNRFARDLHDSVKQQVFATSLQLSAARATFDNEPREARRHLDQAISLVRQAQQELQTLIHEMRPATLQNRGLPAALREHVKNWSSSSEIPAHVNVRKERKLPLELEQAIFRVAQEALANVARHSGADSVELDLTYDGEGVTLRITDDGRGFDPEERRDAGMGLRGMHERLQRYGGYVKVASSPGGGTQVICYCPSEEESKV